MRTPRADNSARWSWDWSNNSQSIWTSEHNMNRSMLKRRTSNGSISDQSLMLSHQFAIASVCSRPRAFSCNHRWIHSACLGSNVGWIITLETLPVLLLELPEFSVDLKCTCKVRLPDFRSIGWYLSTKTTMLVRQNGRNEMIRYLRWFIAMLRNSYLIEEIRDGYIAKWVVLL